MNARNSVCYQVDYLRQRIGHSCIEKRLAVVLISSDYPAETFRGTCVAKTDHALDLVCVDDRHNARNNRHVDTCDPASLTEIVEDPVLEKRVVTPELPHLNLLLS